MRRLGKLLLFWLSRSALCLDILRCAALAQEIFDAEERFERVLPKWRAHTQQHDHDGPADQCDDVAFQTFPPFAACLQAPGGGAVYGPLLSIQQRLAVFVNFLAIR